MEQINFEKILEKHVDGWCEIDGYTDTLTIDVINAMKDVWNKAIETAAEEVKLKVLSKYEVNNPYVDIPFVVDKQSILKLKV